MLLIKCCWPAINHLQLFKSNYNEKENLSDGFVLSLYFIGFLANSEFFGVYRRAGDLLKKSVSVHLVSDQPMRYLYSSLSRVELDQPMEGLIRVSLANCTSIAYGDGLLTLAREKEFAQFQLIFNHPFPDSVFRPSVRIGSQDRKRICDQRKKLREKELSLAHELLKSLKGIFQTHEDRSGIKARLNKIATLDDYIFIDLGFNNKSNIGYVIDQLSFSLEDKKMQRRPIRNPYLYFLKFRSSWAATDAGFNRIRNDTAISFQKALKDQIL